MSSQHYGSMRACGPTWQCTCASWVLFVHVDCFSTPGPEIPEIRILLDMAQNRFFALYGFWEGLVWCEILPQGVGTICPYFWEVIFFAKIEKCKLFFYEPILALGIVYIVLYCPLSRHPELFEVCAACRRRVFFSGKSHSWVFVHAQMIKCVSNCVKIH